MEKRDIIYQKYKDSTNMTCSEMKKWESNLLSREASLDRKPIKRNVKLLCTPKNEWDKKLLKEANKAISYLARAKKIKSKNYVGSSGLTKNEIALKNWAYDSKRKKGGKK